MNALPQTWLAAYLYYAEPWEEFLVHAVHPFVETMLREKLAEQFFFIRYWERGPHIRLRFKGAKGILDGELKPRLEPFFTQYYEKHPSQRKAPQPTQTIPDEQRWLPNNSIQYTEYEPEIDRYGGPEGIIIAEKQFEASSKAVLFIIKEGLERWNYNRALGAAIQLHLGFAFALGMSRYELEQFYSYTFKTMLKTFASPDPNTSKDKLETRQAIILETFEKNLDQQRFALLPYHQIMWTALQSGAEFEQEWLNTWLREMTAIGNELERVQKSQRLILPQEIQSDPQIDVPEANQKLWSVLSSYVHMTNNRLGIFNQDEAYLSYLIKRCIEQL